MRTLWLCLVVLTAGLAGATGHASKLRRCGYPYAPAPELRLPAGFRGEIYAGGLHRPTALAWGPRGLLYATQEEGEIVAIGRGTCRPRVLARGFEVPLGLVWIGSNLYVSSQGRVSRMTLRARDLSKPRAILTKLPFGRHQQDNIVLGPDGRLYLGNGSTCDACREKNPRSATILSFRPDGSDLRIVARGLRNPFGLTFRPGTNQLYATVNGQDELGTKRAPEPAETVVRVRRGAYYGWPRCWASAQTLTLNGSCDGVTPPAAYLEPHSSADGLVFYDGRNFPRAYRGQLFVAEWGQYLEARFGRRVVSVRLAADGAKSEVRAFADGFDHPLALVVAPDGALFVADHGRGLVYRIVASS